MIPNSPVLRRRHELAENMLLNWRYWVWRNYFYVWSSRDWKCVPSMTERNKTGANDCKLFRWSLKVRVALWNQISIFSGLYAHVNSSCITNTHLSRLDEFKHSRTRPIKLLKHYWGRSSINQKGDSSMLERNRTSGDDWKIFGESLKVRVSLCNWRLIFDDS